MSYEDRIEPAHVPLGRPETDAVAILRDPKGRFLDGTGPGPGRTPSGRRAALALIERLMANADNQATLYAAMQTSFDENPLSFYRRYVMPLLPRDVRLDVGDGVTVAAAVLSVRQALGMPNTGGNGGGNV